MDNYLPWQVENYQVHPLSSSPNTLRYELLAKSKVFDSPFELVFMTCRHPFSRFIAEFLCKNKSIEVNSNQDTVVTLGGYFQYISTRISTSYANNHVRKQVDFYGEKVDYIKK